MGGGNTCSMKSVKRCISVGVSGPERPSNPENADPTKEVTWGEQSWDEMMVGFFNLVFDAKLPVENLFPGKKNRSGIASK